MTYHSYPEPCPPAKFCYLPSVSRYLKEYLLLPLPAPLSLKTRKEAEGKK